MIKNIIQLLAFNDWLIGDEDINIAKGKYAAPKGWKDLRLKLKRWQ